MQPQLIDSFLPWELYARLRALIADAPLKAGAKSHYKNDPTGHLSWKPVYDERKNLANIAGLLPAGPLDDAWRAVGFTLVGLGYKTSKLIRAYVNVYGYGMDGFFHTDSERVGETTVILYLCDTWDRDWAGETVIEYNKQLWTALPAPNRAVILPSHLWHCARGVSRTCPVLRTVLVLKLRPPRSNEFELLSQWLVKHNALSRKHQDGSLHDHLVRVFQLLEDRGCPVEVCLGGGLHSIYGTNAFHHRLLSPTPDQRSAVAREFGRDAEELAYTFSLLDRPQTLEDVAWSKIQLAPDDTVSLKLSHADYYRAGVGATRNLCLIEAANLADQSFGKGLGSLDKWPHLHKMWSFFDNPSTRAQGSG